MTARTTTMTTLLALLLGGPAVAAAQHTGAEPPRTAEELHAERRLWLERQRLGDSASVHAPIYRGARGPSPSALGAASGAASGSTAGAIAPFFPATVQPRYGAPIHPFDAPTAIRRPGHYAPPFRHFEDPAYPRVNRFHNRFFPPEPWAVPPPYGSELHIVPPLPWVLPPWHWGLMPSGCALLSVSGLAGSVTLHVALPLLGATTPDELELVIDARLSQRMPVVIHALDGRWLRIAPGAELLLSARHCSPRFP